MKTLTFAAALALLAATGAAAKDKDQSAGQAQAEKKICQSEHVTGSLARTQEICMTRAEWDALRHRSKQNNKNNQHNNGAIAGQSGMASSSGIVR